MSEDPGRRLLQSTGFDGDDGSADPELASALIDYQRGHRDRYALYPLLAGKRVLAPVVAVLGEAEQAGVSAAGVALKRDKDSDMALVTLVAADGAKAVPVFTSTRRLIAWGTGAGYPQARPVPISIELAAAASLQEQADALLLDLGSVEQFELTGSALRAFADGRVPLAPDSDPEVVAALTTALKSVPELAEALREARIGAFAEGAVLELGFQPGVDPRSLTEPLRRAADAIAADPVLRDRLGEGLSITAAPD
ncbi:MAG TPA: SseB family protein [Actinocrinis sp.]|nr:SseB family protein [Actinocrinis sp.]